MRIFLLLNIMFLICSSLAADGNLPLYRHAMEKWEPDSYRAIVVYNGESPLDKEQGLKYIEGMLQDKTRTLNLVVGKADINDKAVIDERTTEILKTFKPDRLPFTVIYFPAISNVDIPLWAGYLTVPAAEQLADSPVRREIARKLLKGDNAVWLFIDSGNEENDAKAFQILSEEIRLASGVLPEVPRGDGEKELAPDMNTGEGNVLPANPLKMSVIKFSRDDKAELILLEMLNCIEPEMINAKNEPVIAPVYGKGRLLDILSSDEVCRENIRSAVQKLAGGFSGEGKLSDSGTDLLMGVNWNAFLKNELNVDKNLAPLKAFSEGKDNEVSDMLPPQDENVSVPETSSELAAVEESPPPPPPVQMKVINLFLVLVIVFLSILFVIVVMKLRK